MFSSKRQLLKRTPDNGTDRENFLSLLVDEYLNSSSYDAKCQVLANLANFAYDPVNYGYIRSVGVLDIFLHVLKSETNEKLLHFASSGICNLILDPQNQEYVLEQSGLNYLLPALKINNKEIQANIITILIYIYNEKTQHLITSPIVDTIKTFQTLEDKRLSNLATIFLQDVIGKE